MTKEEFTSKTDLFLSALQITMSVPMSAISMISVIESITTLIASKYITVATKISLKSGTDALGLTSTSAKPILTYSALKTNLIKNGFTSTVTDKGTVLDMAQVLLVHVVE